MSIYTNFLRLCNEKGQTPSAVCEAIGIDRSAATRWKNPNVTPNMRTLLKLADYFNVPVKSITDEDEPNGIDVLFNPTHLEKRLVYAWREATPKDKRIIEAVLSVYGFSLNSKKEPLTEEDVG